MYQTYIRIESSQSHGMVQGIVLKSRKLVSPHIIDRTDVPSDFGSGKPWQLIRFHYGNPPQDSKRHIVIGNPRHTWKETPSGGGGGGKENSKWLIHINGLVGAIHIHCRAMAIDNGIVVLHVIGLIGLDGRNSTLSTSGHLSLISFDKQEWIGMQPNISFIREQRKAGYVPLKNQKDTWIFCVLCFLYHLHNIKANQCGPIELMSTQITIIRFLYFFVKYFSIFLKLLLPSNCEGSIVTWV